MGIYIFNMDLLAEVLKRDYTDHQLDDFGGDIIPHLIRIGKRVFGYNFEGYWRDIGTIRTFYDTNLELTEDHRTSTFFDPEHPFYPPTLLPGSRVTGTTCKNVLLAEGCEIQDASLQHSLDRCAALLVPAQK